MVASPDNVGWVEWLTLVFSVAVSIVSGTGAAGFFVGGLRKEIEVLRERTDQAFVDRDQLRTDLRDAVHDMRNDLQKAISSSARAEDTRRIEAHLVRQDERLDKIIALLPRH